MLKGLLLTAAIVGMASGLVARADTFTFTDSIGAKYALDTTSLGGGNFDVFLTIDASGPLSSGAIKLGDVAFKVGPNGTGSYVSAPSGYPSSGFEAGGLGNGGCDGSGNGFFCFNGSMPAGSSGDVYTFEYLLTGATLDSTGSIKDQFFNVDGAKVEQLSQDGVTIGTHTPPVPEPSSLMLLGTGALAAAGVVRRRFAH